MTASVTSASTLTIPYYSSHQIFLSLLIIVVACFSAFDDSVFDGF